MRSRPPPLLVVCIPLALASGCPPSDRTDGAADGGATTDASDGGEAALDASAAPACGDGVEAPDEGCDDGNTLDGDGCDEHCRPEPYDCPDTKMDLACGVPAVGVVGPSGPPSAGTAERYCLGAYDDEWGAEQLFRFEAPAGEEVVFHLEDAAGDLDLFVTNDCDPDACLGAGAAAAAAGEELVRVTVVSGRTYRVFVDGHAGGEGPFTVRAGCASTAACGDALLDGGEACDDGNILGGDGCSAACRLEVDGALCAGDDPPGPTVLSAGVPATVYLGDVSASANAGAVSCATPYVGCSTSAPEIVAEVVLPAGTTDLEVAFDHTGGDQLYAVTAGGGAGAACAELACLDPYPAQTGTHVFAGVSGGATATTVYLVAEACDAMGPSGVPTTVVLTAN